MKMSFIVAGFIGLFVITLLALFAKNANGQSYGRTFTDEVARRMDAKKLDAEFQKLQRDQFDLDQRWREFHEHEADHARRYRGTVIKPKNLQKQRVFMPFQGDEQVLEALPIDKSNTSPVIVDRPIHLYDDPSSVAPNRIPIPRGDVYKPTITPHDPRKPEIEPQSAPRDNERVPTQVLPEPTIIMPDRSLLKPGGNTDSESWLQLHLDDYFACRSDRAYRKAG